MTDRVNSTVSIGSLLLQSGEVIPEVEVAYSTYGTLAPDARNAVLITHGFTSSHHMLSTQHHTAEGSWARLVGPGRPLDTDRFYVVCSNMLGSAFGTTGPRTVNPSTGRPWGGEFPAITMADIVGVQAGLLKLLGVKHLRAVAGPSYGGWQALQWALDHPDMVDAIGVMVSGLTHPSGLSADSIRERFAQSPEWRGGNYYAHGGMPNTLLQLRLQTLRDYGLERLYVDRMPLPEQRQEALERQAQEWARQFDPHSMVALAGAAQRFDARDRMHEIRARLLFMVCNTDKIFPPDEAVTRMLERVPGQTRYVELDSPYGHLASGVESEKLEPDLRWLLD